MAKISDIKFFLFDMDGTLIDSMPYWRLTTLEFLIKHGLPIGADTLSDFIYVSSRKLCSQICEENGVYMTREEIVGELERYMSRHYQNDVHKKPYIAEFLDKLKASGVKMSVATAAPRSIAANALYKMDLLKYFDFVTDTYELGVKKDGAEYFLKVAERMGTPIERCRVFEDALYAVRGVGSSSSIRTMRSFTFSPPESVPVSLSLQSSSGGSPNLPHMPETCF